MKLFVVVVVVLSACVAAATSQLAVTPQQASQIQQVKRICIAETGVNEALIEQYKNGIYYPDPRFKCFAACGLKKYGIMTPTGAINSGVFDTTLRGALPPQVVEEIRSCVGRVGMDGCETGGFYLECMRGKTGVQLL